MHDITSNMLEVKDMLEEYDLSSIKRHKQMSASTRRTNDSDDQYESFNISKELDKIREKHQEKKNRKRFGWY